MIQKYIALVSGLVTTSASLLLDQIPANPIPYHTSALSGEAWVIELILGHPKRIQCELGVTVHTFKALIQELELHGCKNSRNVSLEEQLAIFLYTCITGLSVRHVGERFQWSNETVSQ
jgi:hypothetical protein